MTRTLLQRITQIADRPLTKDDRARVAAMASIARRLNQEPANPIATVTGLCGALEALPAADQEAVVAAAELAIFGPATTGAPSVAKTEPATPTI